MADSEKSSARRSDVERAPGDVGVPMLAGAADEPVGPEDALGDGPKRGDYSDRILGVEHTGEEPQAPKASERGDEPGKGGVSTKSALDADAARLKRAAERAAR